MICPRSHNKYVAESWDQNQKQSLIDQQRPVLQTELSLGQQELNF